MLLVLMGWANIYSAAFDPDHPSIFDQSREYGKQGMWIGICLLIGIGCLIIRGKFYRDFSYIIYLGFMLLLAAVLVAGKEVNGAKSWFGVGSFGIQPSEFAKFSTALALSYFLASLKDIKGKRPRIISGLLILIPAGLIMLQPDTGTALVFGAFIFVLYREGLSGNLLLIGVVAGVLAVSALILKQATIGLPFTDASISGQYFMMVLIVLFCAFAFWVVRNFIVPRLRRKYYWILGATVIGSVLFISSVDYIFEHVLADHHQTRVNILLGLEEDPQGYGYNVKQSKTAIGSGGFSGKGFLDGTLTKHKYVPMQSTDFIFCTVGEEWGFIGTSMVVILFTALILRIILISDRQRSRFTKIYAYCVAMIFFLHLAINVGMTIGLAPVIGIPLPFFSYGGSSLIGFTIMLSILLRLDAERLRQL
jgi:rod shape determining protein RodA